jgi:hypothetical protein
MMWQVPALSLTAQAFLLTIVFGNDARAGRVTAALLAGVTALATVQLLFKHRSIEETYSHLLERIERDHGLPAIHARPDHVRAWSWPDSPWDTAGTPSETLLRWLAAQRSHRLWAGTLLIFALVDVAAAVIILATG